MEGAKGTWTEDHITVVMTRRTVVQLDGSTQEITHPANGSMIVSRTTVEPPPMLRRSVSSGAEVEATGGEEEEEEEECCAHVVVSTYEYQGYGHSQCVRRMLLDDGETYLATNRLTLKSGTVLYAKTYWKRDVK